MQTLREALHEAQKNKTALGHFNVSNIEMLWAVVRAGQKTGLPVIVGVSEGERDLFGVNQIVALVQSIRNETGQSLFLNADHTYSVERVFEAIDAGFDSVIFDGAQLTLEENIRLTQQCVEYARESGRDVLIEGELGFIGTGSQVIDAIPEGAQITEEHMTTSEDAEHFVKETGVDLFAPAVGNLHGTLRNAPDPRLSIHRIQEIVQDVSVPLVLHGGSGLPDEDFIAAIVAGISLIHISTDLRLAYRTTLEEALHKNPDELAPYKLMKPVVGQLETHIEKWLRLFSRA